MCRITCRVACLLLFALALASAFPASFAFAQADTIGAQWTVYRGRFVTEEGRVLDTGNKQISHTEGQGFAMLLANAAGDKASFTKIWDWTRTNLQRRDGLFSWEWDPSNTKKPVRDPNDASDGDILIAWALARAGRSWDDHTYTAAARRIIANIRRHLLVRAPGRLVLLPGADGFKKDGITVVNPSYYVFPALSEFIRLSPSPEWQRLRHDGLGLLSQARFGRWGLTPDWIDVAHDGDIALSAKYPPRFGYEAMRVPLYLIWGGDATEARLASYLDFWNEYGAKPLPAWADLKDNNVAPFAGSTGLRAIAQLARQFGQANPAALPPIGDQDDYYAASLTLLAAVAQQELQHR
jgi:endoglucanase